MCHGDFATTLFVLNAGCGRESDNAQRLLSSVESQVIGQAALTPDKELRRLKSKIFQTAGALECLAPEARRDVLTTSKVAQTLQIVHVRAVTVHSARDEFRQFVAKCFSIALCPAAAPVTVMLGRRGSVQHAELAIGVACGSAAPLSAVNRPALVSLSQ